MENGLKNSSEGFTILKDSAINLHVQLPLTSLGILPLLKGSIWPCESHFWFNSVICWPETLKGPMAQGNPVLQHRTLLSFCQDISCVLLLHCTRGADNLQLHPLLCIIPCSPYSPARSINQSLSNLHKPEQKNVFQWGWATVWPPSCTCTSWSGSHEL